jgi:hypothetical protein
MMEADRFQNAVIAELAALKYIVEQIGEIAFLAATMRPAHAAAMRQRAREKLSNETYPSARWASRRDQLIWKQPHSPVPRARGYHPHEEADGT